MPQPKPLSITKDRLQALKDELDAKGIEFVRFEQTDTHGTSRSKTVPTRHLTHFATHGLNFLLGQLGFDVQSGVAPEIVRSGMMGSSRWLSEKKMRAPTPEKA